MFFMHIEMFIKYIGKSNNFINNLYDGQNAVGNETKKKRPLEFQ